MKIYYYISSPFSYRQSILEKNDYVYYSAYNIFDSIQKLDFTFNFKNKFFELINYKKINHVINKFILNTDKDDIFIFSANAYDVFSFILRDKLLKNNRKIIVNEFDPVRQKLNINNLIFLFKLLSIWNIIIEIIKSRIKVLIIRLLYGIKLYTVVGCDISIGIPYNLLNSSIKRVPFKIHKDNIPDNCSGFNILYVNPLESEFLKCIDINHYKNLLIQFFENKSIYIKIHPREQFNSIFLRKNNIKFQNNLDATFISNVSIAIGVSSTLLVELSMYKHIRVISIIHLLKWKSKKKQNQAHLFMKIELERFGSNIFYPKSIEEFQKLCVI